MPDHASVTNGLVYVEQDDAFMLYNRSAWTFDFKIAGIPRFAGTNTTRAGSALLGANCPAVTPTAPYTWFQVKTADGSSAYVPRVEVSVECQNATSRALSVVSKQLSAD